MKTTTEYECDLCGILPYPEAYPCCDLTRWEELNGQQPVILRVHNFDATTNRPRLRIQSTPIKGQ